MLELVEELGAPGGKSGAARGPIEQGRPQVGPGAAPDGGHGAHDHGGDKQVEAVVLEVQSGRHQHGGGGPIPPACSPVGEDEAREGQDGRQHQPGVHAGLGTVVIEVGARRHQSRCSPRRPAPEQPVPGPPGGGDSEHGGDHGQGVGGRYRPAEQAHPVVQKDVVEGRRTVVDEVVGECPDRVGSDADGDRLVAPVARPQAPPTKGEGQGHEQHYDHGVEVPPPGQVVAN